MKRIISTVAALVLAAGTVLGGSAALAAGNNGGGNGNGNAKVWVAWKLAPGSTLTSPWAGGAQAYVVSNPSAEQVEKSVSGTCGIFQVDRYFTKDVAALTADGVLTHKNGKPEDQGLALEWYFIDNGPCVTPPPTPEPTEEPTSTPLPTTTPTVEPSPTPEPSVRPSPTPSVPTGEPSPTTPTPTSTPVSPNPTSVPTTVPNVTLPNLPKTSAPTCASFSTQEQAQAAFTAGNTSLDGDGDGLACNAYRQPKTLAATGVSAGAGVAIGLAAIAAGIGAVILARRRAANN